MCADQVGNWVQRIQPPALPCRRRKRCASSASIDPLPFGRLHPNKCPPALSLPPPCSTNCCASTPGGAVPPHLVTALPTRHAVSPCSSCTDGCRPAGEPARRRGGPVARHWHASQWAERTEVGLRACKLPGHLRVGDWCPPNGPGFRSCRQQEAHSEHSEQHEQLGCSVFGGVSNLVVTAVGAGKARPGARLGGGRLHAAHPGLRQQRVLPARGLLERSRTV